jgi:uncharacterized protein (TIGR00730 family)
MSTTRIAVFGSAEPLPGEPLYEQARRLGGLLARAGYAVVTGGYGGVMEGVSRGATEAGGRTVGVTCAIFAQRTPNPYLGEVHEARDLHSRQRELIQQAGGYVVLPGKAGTLAELAMLWALNRAGCLPGRPVVLLGGPWKALIDRLSRDEMLEAPQLSLTQVVASPEVAVRTLAEFLRRNEEN